MKRIVQLLFAAVMLFNIANAQTTVKPPGAIGISGNFFRVAATDSVYVEMMGSPKRYYNLGIYGKINQSLNTELIKKLNISDSVAKYVTPSMLQIAIKTISLTPGPKGDKGDKGDRGDTGLTGSTGDQGLQGIQGVQGIQGIQGERGETGLRGLQGDQGIQGQIGETGLKGDPGIQGIQGLTGLTGAKGDKGDKGDQGADGTGVSIIGSLPNTGALPASGTLGDAYIIDGHLWVWDGAAWIDAGNIKGPKGDQGIQGVQGNPGDQGIQGVKGDQGIQGLIGLTGNQGIQGATGLQGEKGDTGTQGIQGIQGPAGSDATVPDATTSVKGKIQLDGGTAAAPTVYDSNRWGGERYGGALSGSATYSMLYDAGINKWTAATAEQARVFQGSPSGGETLQSVTDRGNTTSNTVRASNFENTSTSGYLYTNNIALVSSGSPFVLDYTSSTYAQFKAGATDVMRLTNTGDVGIGTTTPIEKLQVNGNVFASTGAGGGFKLEDGISLAREAGYASLKHNNIGVINYSSGGNIELNRPTSVAGDIMSSASGGAFRVGPGNWLSNYIIGKDYDATLGDFTRIGVAGGPDYSPNSAKLFGNGNLIVTGQVTAPQFNGALNGSALYWNGVPYGGTSSSVGISNLFGFNDNTGTAHIIGLSDARTWLDLGTAAYRNYGTGPTQVPLNSQLGSNAYTSTPIPTNNNQLTNGSGFITSAALSGYALLSGANVFTGANTFSGLSVLGGSTFLTVGAGSYPNVEYRDNGIIMKKSSTASTEYVPGYIKVIEGSLSQHYLMPSNLTSNGTINFPIGNGTLALDVPGGFLPLSGGDVTGTMTVRMNAPASSIALDVGGNVRAFDFALNSDSTLKKNIKPLTNSIEKLGRLKGYSYDWKRDGSHAIGVIAQEVQKEYPEAVFKDDKGILSVAYSKLVAPLIQANNEQQKEIDQLKKDIQELKQLIKR